MKLFEKLEALVDELTGLVKEERARRSLHPQGDWVPLCGPRGTEMRVPLDPFEMNFNAGAGGNIPHTPSVVTTGTWPPRDS